MNISKAVSVLRRRMEYLNGRIGYRGAGKYATSFDRAESEAIKAVIEYIEKTHPPLIRKRRREEKPDEDHHSGVENLQQLQTPVQGNGPDHLEAEEFHDH